jgi:hypothetical protein
MCRQPDPPKAREQAYSSHKGFESRISKQEFLLSLQVKMFGQPKIAGHSTESGLP